MEKASCTENKYRRKKKRLFSFAILMCLLPFQLLYLAPGSCYDGSIGLVADETAEIFFDKSYMAWEGGEEAASFFDSYAVAEGYERIWFTCNDYSARPFLLKNEYRVCYSLEVYYTESMYQRVVANLMGRALVCLSQKNEIGFAEYLVTENTAAYEKNEAYILIDRHHTTIQYIFLTDRRGAVSMPQVCADIQERIHRDLFVDWQFDYTERLFPVFEQMVADMYPGGYIVNFPTPERFVGNNWRLVIRQEGKIHLAFAYVNDTLEECLQPLIENGEIGQSYEFSFTESTGKTSRYLGMFCYADMPAPEGYYNARQFDINGIEYIYYEARLPNDS